MNSAFRQQIALFLGMTLILAVYFWAHNVGDQPVILANALIAAVGTAADLLTVSLIAVISGGIGRRICRAAGLNPSDLHRSEVVAIESGLGLGVLSLGALILGLVGLFNIVMWAALLLVGAWCFRDVRGWAGDLRTVLRSAGNPQTAWERVMAVLIGLLLLAALLLAFAPPFAWDGLTYHLLGPQHYLRAGHIFPVPDNHYLGFPQGVEMLFGLAMSLFGRATAAAAVHFYMGFLGLLATAGVVRRYADRTTAYVSVLLLLSSYSLWLQFTIPYVDLGVMLYGALALIAIVRWREAPGTKWLILAGVFAGLALGIKYTAGLLGIALGVIILIRQPSRILSNGLILAGATLIVFLPWMLKGALLYQNPVYPYGFGGLNWDDLRAAAFNGSDSGMLATDISWQWFVLPLSATLFGAEAYSPYAFTLGSWLLTMPLVLLIGWRNLGVAERALGRTCILLVLPVLALWMLMAATSGIGAQPRLILVAAPAAAVLGGLAFRSLAQGLRGPLNMDFIMRAALAFTVLLGGVNIAHDLAKAQPGTYYVENNADGYLRNNLGNFYATMRELDSLPEGSTVLFLWEPKGFYCPDDITCLPDPLFDHWFYPLRTGQADGDTLMQQWRDQDAIDFLLVWGLDEGSGFGYDLWLEKDAFARSENEQFPAKLAQYAEPVWTDGRAYTLYTWKGTPASS